MRIPEDESESDREHIMNHFVVHSTYNRTTKWMHVHNIEDRAFYGVLRTRIDPKTLYGKRGCTSKIGSHFRARRTRNIVVGDGRHFVEKGGARGGKNLSGTTKIPDLCLDAGRNRNVIDTGIRDTE